MAFCPNCGAQAQGAFCPNCGSPMGNPSAASGPAPGGSASGSSAFVPPPVAVSSGLEPHIASALCYTPFAIGLLVSIIFLLIAPYNQNKFVRFSAFQSLFLHLALFILGIALTIIVGVISAMIHVFALILLPIWPLLWLAILILFLFMMYKSFNNQKVRLPVIGDLADKQA